jgi:putative transposase
VITQAKKSEMSNIPSQQSVADLGVAYKNFFDSRSCKRKGKKVGLPPKNPFKPIPKTIS